jgi:hypothetical protein
MVVIHGKDEIVLGGCISHDGCDGLESWDSLDSCLVAMLVLGWFSAVVLVTMIVMVGKARRVLHVCISNNFCNAPQIWDSSGWIF